MGYGRRGIPASAPVFHAVSLHRDTCGTAPIASSYDVPRDCAGLDAPTRPLIGPNVKDELIRVRAFDLDTAHWV